MFFSQILNQTRLHLESHLPALIIAESLKYSDALPLEYPKYIDISSVLGGLINVARETLPQYAIDCNYKERLTTGDNLWDYTYEGQFSFLCSAADPLSAEELARRHAAVLEEFCRTHEFLHQYQDSDGFIITGFDCGSVELTGVMKLNEEGNPEGELWAAGGTVELAWKVAETGYFQHGS